MKTTRDIMTAAGWEDCSTGGGCTGWCQDMPDGSHLLICTSAQSHVGDPEARDWLVGRHGPNGGFIEIVAADTGMNLTEALAVAPRIPAPVESGDDVQQDTFISIDECLTLHHRDAHEPTER